MVPSLKQHILKVHLRNPLDGRNVKKIAHGTIGGFEMTDRVQHLLVLLRNPVRGLELLVCDLGDPNLNNDTPTDLISWNKKRHPLLR